MCVMRRQSRVGVRELRQNLSVYLRRIAAGETLEVTERGHPVARLTPLPAETSVDRMIADGRVIPAEGDLLALGPPLRPRRAAQPLSEVLQEMRNEDPR